MYGNATITTSPLSLEQLDACLRNLFSSPSQSLKEAFDIVVSMMKYQANEIAELKSSQETHRSETDKMYEKLRNEAEESNDVLRIQFETSQNLLRQKDEIEIKRLMNELDGMAKEQNNANKIVSPVPIDASAQLTLDALQVEVQNLRQELKVMAYNFHGCDDEEEEKEEKTKEVKETVEERDKERTKDEERRAEKEEKNDKTNEVKEAMKERDKEEGKKEEWGAVKVDKWGAEKEELKEKEYKTKEIEKAIKGRDKEEMGDEKEELKVKEDKRKEVREAIKGRDKEERGDGKEELKEKEDKTKEVEEAIKERDKEKRGDGKEELKEKDKTKEGEEAIKGRDKEVKEEVKEKDKEEVKEAEKKATSKEVIKKKIKDEAEEIKEMKKVEDSENQESKKKTETIIHEPNLSLRDPLPQVTNSSLVPMAEEKEEVAKIREYGIEALLPAQEQEALIDYPSIASKGIHETDAWVQRSTLSSLATRRPSTRRKSIAMVTKHKLELHETVAGRLETLENLCYELARELCERKGVIQLDDNYQPGFENYDRVDEDIIALNERVLSVETFLSERTDRNAEEEVHRGNSEVEIPEENADRNNLIVVAPVEHACRNEVVVEISNPRTVSEVLEVQMFRDNQTNEPGVTVATDKDASSPTTEGSALNKRFEWLVLRMQDQDFFFKQTINDLSGRLDDFDEQMSQRVTRGFLDVQLKHLKTEESLPQPIPENDDKKTLEIAKADLSDLRKKLVELTDEVADKVPKSSMATLRALVEASAASIHGDAHNDANIMNMFLEINEHLDTLRSGKVDKTDMLQKLIESQATTSSALDEAISGMRLSQLSVINSIQLDLNICREDITEFDQRIRNRREERSSSVGVGQNAVEAMIKMRTDAVHDALEVSISNRLSALRAIEDELEHLASKLVEKPDQDQINSMLNDLEQAFSRRMIGDDNLQILMNNMKSELRQRMTKDDVLGLVRRLLHGAQEKVQDDADSLMIGRKPYRCIGCNQLFPDGVHGRLAAKVNHDALPCHKSVSPFVTPYNRVEQSSLALRGKPGVLRPLKIISAQGRPRTTGALNQFRRASSCDISRMRGPGSRKNST